jgi:hypothetical protein
VDAFTQVVVGTSGQMATMHTPSPSSFVRIKTAIAERPDRDPLKSPKDKLHAQVVQKLLTGYGLHRSSMRVDFDRHRQHMPHTRVASTTQHLGIGSLHSLWPTVVLHHHPG